MSEASELTPEEQELLDSAIKNLQSFIEDSTTHYALIEDPRNDEDYDTFEYGTEPLPGDETWKKPEDAASEAD